MSKRILIAYANKPLYKSLALLGAQARYTHVFDKITLYTEKDLSPVVLSSPLMKYSRGGGYWVWKPYLIWKTLQSCDEGDIVCYLDSGNTVCAGKEWNDYFSYLEQYQTLCFQYHKVIPCWVNRYKESSTAIKLWSKKITLDYFRDSLKDDEFLNFSKVMGGVIFCRGKNNAFIKEWLNISLAHPEFIIDPTEEELKDQYPFFTGYHRHDQSIITPLAYKYQKEGSLLVLPERFDINRNSDIIKTDRRKPKGMRYYKELAKIHIKGIFGEKRIHQLKDHLHK